MKAIYLFLCLGFFNLSAFADEQFNNSCDYLQKIIQLNSVDQLVNEGAAGSTELLNLKSAYKALCRFSYSDGSTVYYPNGKTATISYGRGGYNWYYPNGKTITSGSSYSTWYYSNGTQIASSQELGYTVYYPNGQMATSSWLRQNATWYYSNHQMITVSAGSQGYTWYYPNAKIISSSMGRAGSTWYHMNGNILTNNGPEISEEEMVDVPNMLSYIFDDGIDDKTDDDNLFESKFSISAVNVAPELILQKNLTITTDQFNLVLGKTEQNVKLFVDNFNLVLDGGSKITKAKEVLGSLVQPVLKVSVKKCVFIVCNTIDLDADFTLVKTTGACHANYTLVGNLQRSSTTLANLYSQMNTNLCINQTATGATVALTVSLTKAAQFKTGMVQSEILKFFKLQAPSIVESFKKVLKLNGAKEVI